MVLRIFTQSFYVPKKDESGFNLAQERVIVSGEHLEYRLETRYKGKSYFYEISSHRNEDEGVYTRMLTKELICSDFESYLNEISSIIKNVEECDKEERRLEYSKRFWKGYQNYLESVSKWIK